MPAGGGQRRIGAAGLARLAADLGAGSAGQDADSEEEWGAGMRPRAPGSLNKDRCY